MRNSKKGFGTLWILVFVTLLFGGGTYLYMTQRNQTVLTTPLPPTQNSITVLYPTAGMVFPQDKGITISWKAVNADANYKLVSVSELDMATDIGSFSASQAQCSTADTCTVSWVPTFTSQRLMISVYDTVSGRFGSISDPIKIR